MSKTLYIFDFDGTLTNKDSLADFIQYSIGKKPYYIGLFKLSPVLLFCKLGLIPNYLAKEKLITYFFKDWDFAQFKAIADKYALEEIDKIIRPLAMKKIESNKEQDHQMIVVSASMESWLEKWCDKNQIEVIGTRLEILDGKLTGKFATKNCCGIEKVKRIKEKYNLNDFDVIHVFGDSRGDKEMLKIGDHSYYRYFE